MPAIPFDQFPGLGDDDYPGFPADACPDLPDLSRHCSVCADILKAHPEIYEQLKARKTAKGVTLARCIKSGIDNRGHPVLKALGAVAGDAECYETFAPLFDKLIESRHGQLSEQAKEHVAQCREALGGYVISCKVSASRSLDGFLFPPAAAREDRGEVERLLVDSVLKVEGLKGQYFPLLGSDSYALKPGGMSSQEEKALANDHLLFYHPDAPAVLSTGAGRHWPHGRGIFVNDRKTITLWINEEEHLKLTSQRMGGDVWGAYQELKQVLDAMSTGLPSFASSRRLGYLTSNPSNLGTALRVSVIVKLPLLKQHKELLRRFCLERRLVEKSTVSESGDGTALLELSSREKFNVTEEETVQLVLQGTRQLIEAERLMEQGLGPLEALRSAVDLEAMQRLAGAILVATEVGGFHEAAALLREEKAVVKIQALQRGRSERKLAEAHDTPQDFEKLRLQLANVLLAAADDGSLQRVLASTFSLPDMPDDEKEILRLQLESSLDKNAFALLEEDDVMERDLEEIRVDLQSMLVESLKTGALDIALQAAFAEDDQDTQTIIMEEPEPVDDAEVLKVRIAQSMLEASITGSLDTALASLQGEGSLDHLRQKAATLLEAACANGSLEAVLGRRARESSEEALRKKAAKLLQAAGANGSLEAALGNLPTKSPSPDAELEALRLRVAGRLESALHDGTLQTALKDRQEARHRSSTDATQDPQDALRDKAAKLLSTSFLDGSLETALKTKDLEHLRNKVGGLLEVASKDGSLQAALEASCATATDLEAVRRKIAFRLEQSASDGTLERMLGGLNDMDDLRMKMGQQLSDAFCDGSLEEALASATDPVENLKSMVAASLSDACLDGSLEAALKAQAVEAAPLVKPPRPPSAQARYGATALLQVMSSYDRRIGKLLEAIAQAELEIMTRSQQTATLEVQIQEANRDLRGLDLVFEKHQLSLNQEEAQHFRLQEERRKLTESLELEKLKMKHAALDQDASTHTDLMSISSRGVSPPSTWRSHA